MKNKVPKHFTVVFYKHGILWWLIFGWWWRPLVYIFYFSISMMLGFRKLEVIHEDRKK